MLLVMEVGLWSYLYCFARSENLRYQIVRDYGVTRQPYLELRIWNDIGVPGSVSML